MALVVADASPLIGLDRSGHLSLLPDVLGRLSAPSAVIAEFGRRPDWLAVVEIESATQVEVLRELRFGRGEAEALAVAMERPGTTLVLDERRARSFARRRGIEVVGTAGILLEAKRIGRIETVRPVLDDLSMTGFRMSGRLRLAVLDRAGELRPGEGPVSG